VESGLFLGFSDKVVLMLAEGWVGEVRSGLDNFPLRKLEHLAILKNL
jgi:hypothetical protein